MPELGEARNLLSECRFEAGRQQLWCKAELLQAFAGPVADDEPRAERIGSAGESRKGHDGYGLHGFLSAQCARAGCLHPVAGMSAAGQRSCPGRRA